MIYLILWFILLVFSILISIFMHEIAHGLSAYLNDIPVSTGFNKVGDIYKKPEDEDFRKEHKNQKNYVDFGVIVTLLLAILFTYLLYNIEHKYFLWIIGALAFTNSILRLIPMVEFSYGVSIISFWFSPGLNPVFYEFQRAQKLMYSG